MKRKTKEPQYIKTAKERKETKKGTEVQILGEGSKEGTKGSAKIETTSNNRNKRDDKQLPKSPTGNKERR